MEIRSPDASPSPIQVRPASLADAEPIGRVLASAFRREEARCMLAEGVKKEEIADLLGVTLDHVDAMLEGRT